MVSKKINIDWDWVRAELLRGEKIPGTKNAILASVDECLKTARSLAKPLVVSIKKEVTRFRPDLIEVDSAIAFCGKKLSSYLKGADLLYIFLVTIGNRLEEAASALMNKGDSLQGYLLDRAGSLAVESLAMNFEDLLRQDYASKGLSVSMRFSPGYCDWPIEEQLKVAKVLDFSKIGVTLTESCMMHPKKSISAMVGIGSKDKFLKKESQCVVCGKSDCDYRR